MNRQQHFSPSSPSSNSENNNTRIWFEYKGKLDCVKNTGSNLEFVADLKQAIHKKLGHSLSSTSLDLELYLQVGNAENNNNENAGMTTNVTKNLRVLRADMPCDFCYGVDLFKVTSQYRVVVLNVPVSRNYQQQQHQKENPRNFNNNSLETPVIFNDDDFAITID